MPLAVKYGGTWRTAIPFVRVNGQWRNGLLYVKRDGVWAPASATHVLTAKSGRFPDLRDGVGYSQGEFGTLSPGTYGGEDIRYFGDTYVGATPAGFWFEIFEPNNLGQSFFASIIINNKTFLSSQATFTFNSGLHRWLWPTNAGLVVDETYPVTIV